MASDQGIARWRLRNQHLVTPHADSTSTVISDLLAVQAENPGQAAWAVASRTRDPRAGDLDALLDDAAVIRTHVLRPTWHYVLAVDIGWLLELTAPRIRPLFARQLTDLGLSNQHLDRAASAVVGALELEPHQTRQELAQCLRDAGIEPDGHTVMVLLGLLEVDRLICSGRPRDGTHTYAAWSQGTGTRRLDREEALAELAMRYFVGHGPATERDLAYWATMTVTDVRRGLALVRDRLSSFEHDGRTFWHAEGEQPPTAPPEPRGHLLQILDELYRGYQDSRMVLDSAGVVPAGRETAIGMALVDGQMIAGMKRTVARKVAFELTPYARVLEPSQRAVLEEAAARYAAFLGLEHELRVR